MRKTFVKHKFFVYIVPLDLDFQRTLVIISSRDSKSNLSGAGWPPHCPRGSSTESLAITLWMQKPKCLAPCHRFIAEAKRAPSF